MWSQNSVRHRQVAAIRRWSLAQVWLYFIDEKILVAVLRLLKRQWMICYSNTKVENYWTRQGFGVAIKNSWTLFTTLVFVLQVVSFLSLFLFISSSLFSRYSLPQTTLQLSDLCNMLVVVTTTRGQFYQHSTRSFWANSLAPVKYKPKT